MKNQTTHNAEYMQALFQGILDIVARPDYLACDTAKLELIKEFAEIGFDGAVVGTGIEDFDDVIAELDRVEAKHSFDRRVLTWARQNEQLVEAEALAHMLRVIGGTAKPEDGSPQDSQLLIDLITEAQKGASDLSESIRDTIEPVQNPKDLPF